VKLQFFGVLHLLAQCVELNFERCDVREDETEKHEAEIAVQRLRPRLVAKRKGGRSPALSPRGREGSRKKGSMCGSPLLCESRSRMVTACRSAARHGDR
jgi:hypothetical protein